VRRVHESDFMDSQEIVGKLTKEELIAVVPPGTFSSTVCRTWDALEKAVSELPTSLKDTIHSAAVAKATRIAQGKRKRTTENQRNVRARHSRMLLFEVKTIVDDQFRIEGGGPFTRI
jgi:hypothetical protein